MRPNRLTVSLLAAAFLLVGIGGAVANNNLRAQPTAVGVVNIEQAFDALTEKSAVEAQIRSRGEQLSREEQQRRQQIRNMQEEIELLNPGSSAYNQKRDELERAVLELQTWTQFQQQRLQREHTLQTERLYRKMLDALSALAEDEGFDMILFREADGRLRAENLQEMVAQIQMRKVLYARDSIDVTAQLAQRMNNAYDAEQ